MARKTPYGTDHRPAKGSLEIPRDVPKQPWKFTDEAVVLGWMWYEGRTWQKTLAFRDWAHEFAFKCGRMAAAEKVWLGHAMIRGLLTDIPDKPEPAAPPAPEPPKAKGAPSEVAASLLRVIGHLIPEEVFDGCNIDQVAREMVDLDVAFSPVLFWAIETRDGIWPAYCPTPARAQKQGGRYCVGVLGSVDFEWVDEDRLKVMRARYLLLSKWYQRNLRLLSHPERQEVLAKFFPGGLWLPEEGSELAKAMGVA